MIYKKFQDKSISALGMGCMRLPVQGGEDKKIDVARAKEMIAYAMTSGINYYDTAWMYHGGQSEPVMGEILHDYPRESFYLASKFPGFDEHNLSRVEEIFETQLKRCQTEYFDFYLFHNVCESNIDGYLDPKYGIFDYLMAQKRRGRIRHLGFSAHGNMDTLKRFLAAYGRDMEFCQLQINWLDWEFQNAKEKVDLMRSYAIPVWVMEPVRGGSLARLQARYEAQLKSLNPDRPTVEWAFRFLQSLPDVVVTLSGMSNFEQLKQNIAIYQRLAPLSEGEKEALFALGREMTAKKTLPCTSCRYCVDHCPRKLDIPKLIELYNEHVYSGGGFIAPMALDALKAEQLPSACVGCRSCEKVCPQTIKISEMMSDFSELIRDE